jgi:hypothetical protein
VIVMPSSGTPGSVAKHFAHSDPEMTSRMAIPPAQPKGKAASA